MMHKTIKLLFVVALFVATLSACVIEPFQAEFPVGKVSGYRPLYGNQATTEVSLLPAQELENPGKIYVYNQYLLINERGKGIHIYNNSNPVNPQSVAFINLLGNTDMAIKDDILYADHNGDLKSIRLNGFNSLSVLDSIPLASWNLGVPPPAGFYFECVDISKGIVIGWQSVELNNPDCYATN
ncbi:lvivd repeat-containing protein [Chryseotalea sanaruensis]|uniref:Lvivd repeat-containing protein n=1 Tax=Chryseotalea sanaruensis TaxID=2482724 RepID=A0A401U556_9BACT|nr:hypothetical protein [Chryseotalea sanaruensis]GCC49995.1 lvivd repeat-containing protein [Chryseotalea sanaruensis]